MKVSHEQGALATPRNAFERLQRFVQQRRSRREPVEDLEVFERELHEYFAAAEREVLAEELSRFDIDVPGVEVGGQWYRKVLRCEASYVSAAGALRVLRSLYARGGERALCPLELRAGLVEGRWTPLAAKQAAWVVAHLTPQEGEELFGQLGNMQPSKSSLDRLPKQLSERWESKRVEFEAVLRHHEQVPAEATTLAVSLDGVMAPMRDGAREAKRAQSLAEGKRTRGPAGYREVGCGTLSFHDGSGQRLSTLRIARMPQRKKATLKAMLSAEVQAALEQCPELTVVKLADGAKDNWTYLSGELPKGVELVDFYHAAGHLKTAFDSAYGENSTCAKAQFNKYRHVLLEQAEGVEKVIRALAYLKVKHPRGKKLATQLGYFRRHRHRMRYADVKSRDLPIGSGVVEAACKTLVTERMKRSGMRWRHPGGQAILTLRALAQSDRFERGWKLLSNTYKRAVSIPENVVLFTPKRTN